MKVVAPLVLALSQKLLSRLLELEKSRRVYWAGFEVG